MTDQTIPGSAVPGQPVPDPATSTTTTAPVIPEQVVREEPVAPEDLQAPLAPEPPPRGGRLRRRRREPRRQSAFRRWRKSRPFWGGLLTMLGGIEIALITAASYELILLSKSVGFAIAVGAAIAVFGLTMWLSPVLSKLLGLLTLVAALLSFVSANLGGFLIGMLLAIVGGSLSFAWEPGKPLETADATVAEPDEEATEDVDSGRVDSGDENDVEDLGTDIFGIPQQRAPEAADQLTTSRDDAGD